jgi:hypothetical protein
MSKPMITDKLSEELKPCPFCGSSASCHNTVAPPHNDWVPYCTNLDCSVEISGRVFLSKQEAVDFWNTRQPDRLKELEAALENIIQQGDVIVVPDKLNATVARHWGRVVATMQRVARQALTAQEPMITDEHNAREPK